MTSFLFVSREISDARIFNLTCKPRVVESDLVSGKMKDAVIYTIVIQA